MRKPHPRRVHTKNGDTQIVRLHHHVLHYKVVGDTRPDASLISIHWRRVNLERVSDLIPGWGPFDTNTRGAQGRGSPITKKFEMRFILTSHRLNTRLLFDASPPSPGHGYPGCRLHPGGRQDLAAALSGWRSHIQRHTHIETYIKLNGDHTFNYIYQLNITQSLCIK
jgi:hypothetical protein